MQQPTAPIEYYFLSQVYQRLRQLLETIATFPATDVRKLNNAVANVIISLSPLTPSIAFHPTSLHEWLNVLGTWRTQRLQLLPTNEQELNTLRNLGQRALTIQSIPGKSLPPELQSMVGSIGTFVQQLSRPLQQPPTPFASAPAPAPVVIPQPPWVMELAPEPQCTNDEEDTSFESEEAEETKEESEELGEESEESEREEEHEAKGSEIAGQIPLWTETQGSLCHFMMQHRLPLTLIESRRRQVERDFKTFLRGRPMVGKGATWHDTDMEELMRLYDVHFFRGALSQALKTRRWSVRFGFSPRCTNTSYTCRRDSQRCQVQVTIGHRVFMRMFDPSHPAPAHPYRFGGLVCHNIVQCLQLTFEAILVHIIMDVFCPGKKPHGKEFFAMVSNWFGHTSTKQDFHTRDWISETGLQIGSEVQYTGTTFAPFRARVQKFLPGTKRVKLVTAQGHTYSIQPSNLRRI